MLVNPLDETVKGRNNLDRPHKGVVVENRDPLMYGAIKVKIEGIFESNTPEKLPWVFPKNQTGGGGRPDCSSFEVPEIGTEVVVEFPFDDVLSPFYTGYWQNANTSQQLLFGEDYPKTYGKVDSTVSWDRTNKKKGYKEYKHHSGSYLQYTNEGDVRCNVKRDLIMHVGRNVILEIDNDSKVLIHGNAMESVIKNKGVSVGEDSIRQISGTDYLQVSGQAVRELLSNLFENVGGNATRKCGGTQNLKSGSSTSVLANGSLAMSGGAGTSVSSPGNFAIDAASIDFNSGKASGMEAGAKDAAASNESAMSAGISTMSGRQRMIPTAISEAQTIVDELDARIVKLERLTKSVKAYRDNIKTNSLAYAARLTGSK